jgi:O-antigen/teichoic acid export membrane protein
LSDSLLTRARPLLVARLAGAILTLAVPMVLARVLVPASYGTFKQAWLIAQTLGLVLPMGMTVSLYYFVPREPEARDSHVAQTLWFHLALGAFAAVLLLAGAPLVDRQFHNPELTQALPWIAAFTGLQIAGAPLDVAWNASGRIGAAAVARLVTEVARGAAILAGAALGGSVEAVFVGITAAHLARAAWTFVALGRAHGLRFSASALRRQAAYALPFGAAFVLIVPQQQFHHYAVASAVSAAAFAVYSVGTFQLPVIDILYTPVSELLQIGLAEVDGAGRPPRAGLHLFHEAVLQLAFAFVPLMGLLAVIAPELIELVFSARYYDAVPLFRLSLLTLALAALPLDGVMRARAQNRYMLGLSVAKLALTAPFVLGGLRAAGPIGALAGWIVAEAATRAFMLRRAARLFEVPLTRVLPWDALVRQVAATIFAMAPAFIVTRLWGTPPLLGIVAACAAFAAAYLGLSWSRGWLPAGWVSLFASRRARTAAAPSEP